MKLRQSIIYTFFVVTSIAPWASAQMPADIQRFRNDARGASSQRLESVLAGNRIRTILSNDGQIGKWMFQPSLLWPEASTVSYLAGHTLLVGAEITTPGNGQTVHSIETSYREYYDVDPSTGQAWGWTPVPGYRKPDRPTPSIALSWDASTWPSTWPAALGLGSSANGAWYSYDDPPRVLGSREIMFVMDDSRDEEWSKAPYGFYPVLSDSSRRGLGLRVEARVFQWSDSIARDMLFMHYDIWNLSDFDYLAASVGILSDPSIDHLDLGDDHAVYDSTHGVVYVYDPNGVPAPVQTTTGYLGYVFLALPGSAEPTTPAKPRSLSFFTGSAPQWRPSNDESVWQAMTSGHIDSSISSSDVVLIMGGGVFSLGRWAKVSFAVAFVMADSLAQLFERADLARQIAARGYRLPETTATFVDHAEAFASSRPQFAVEAFPNPFNPTTTIRYTSPTSAHVRVDIYDLLGKRVASPFDGFQSAGSHDVSFDAGGLASGIYVCQLQVDGVRHFTKLVLKR